MAETHQEVVKVWIAPGCIVCDACETDCPEVFDVQETTCIIRPPALKADFTRPLTPSIKIAAEGCPVDVIKFETVEVEGPEPWAGQEAAAAVTAAAGAAGGGAGAARKPALTVPSGPPDPRWAKLLSTSRTSGSRSGGGPAVTSRPARAPAEAVAAALPANAAPDAIGAAMVGSGFSRPHLSVVQRIRDQAQAAGDTLQMTRRRFNLTLALGWGAMCFTGATVGAALQSFIVPKVTKEPPTNFRAGKLADYRDVGVYTNLKSEFGIWIVHLPDGKLIAISTICTHLGCIPNWLPNDAKFKCPCHGSGFYMTGVNFEGPAPRPLERFKINLEGDYLVVDKSAKFRAELGQWTQTGAFVQV